MQNSAAQSAVWSAPLLDAFGTDARATCRVGEAIPAFFSEPESRVAVMETNIYQGNIYDYSFIRREDEEALHS